MTKIIYSTIALALLALPASAAEPTAEELARRAQQLLAEAYMDASTSRYCTANPRSFFSIEIDAVTIVVRCVDWNIWRGGQP